MRGRKAADRYEAAMVLFEAALRRNDDGTYRLEADDGRSIGIDDPAIFAELRQSLEVTNDLIRRGELDPVEIIQYGR